MAKISKRERVWLSYLKPFRSEKSQNPPPATPRTEGHCAGVEGDSGRDRGDGKGSCGGEGAQEEPHAASFHLWPGAGFRAPPRPPQTNRNRPHPGRLGSEVVRLGDFSFDISDGNYSSKYPRQSDFVPEGIPFIRAINIQDGKIVWKDMKYITIEKHSELQKGHLKRDDILITTRGDIGKVAIVSDEFVGCNINAQMLE